MNPKLLLLQVLLMALWSIQPSSEITDDDLVRRYLPPPNRPFTQKEYSRHFKIIRPVQSANALTPKEYKNLRRTNHFTITPTERTASAGGCACRKQKTAITAKPKTIITRG